MEQDYFSTRATVREYTDEEVSDEMLRDVILTNYIILNSHILSQIANLIFFLLNFASKLSIMLKT